jgi:hypothetical protein
MEQLASETLRKRNRSLSWLASILKNPDYRFWEKERFPETTYQKMKK